MPQDELVKCDYTIAFHSAAVVAFAVTAMVLAIRERLATGQCVAAAVPSPAGS